MEKPAPTEKERNFGDLAEVPFPRVFLRICRKKGSGYLDLRDKPPEEKGKIIKRVVILDGDNFAVLGGARAETLPELLLAKGKLPPEQYENLKKECLKPDGRPDYDRMEKKIISGQVVPAGELPELISEQTSLKIKNLFALIRGFWEWKSMPSPQLAAKHVLMELSPARLLFEGVSAFYPPARIKKEFPGIETKVFRIERKEEEFVAAMGLPPRALRWVRTLPREFTWKSVLSSSPAGPEQGFLILFCLYLAEIIILPPEEEETFPVGRAYEEKPKAPAEKPAAASGPAAKASPAKPEPSRKPEKREEPKLPIEEMLDRDLSDQEILEQIDKLLDIALKKESTYFDLLGVKETTPPDKIKQIYFKFARRFHPDARPALFQGEVREKVEDLFTKISEAYNTLSDPASRAEYVKKLKSKVSEEDLKKAEMAIQAEMEFQKAEILLKKGAWDEAVEHLQKAVEFQPDEPEYQLHLAWARYKQKGPGEAEKALRIIKDALKQRPKAGDGYAYLGYIYKALGRLNEAEENFRKALDFKPHDIDLKRELKLLEKRFVQKPSSPKGGGLFGRKK